MIGTALSSIGRDSADRLARRLGRGVFKLNTAGRMRAEARMRSWLGDSASPLDGRLLVERMYEHAGRFWIESLYLARVLRESSWRRFVTVRREELWKEIEHSPRGCLIATPYFGHVGVLAYALGQFFRPLYVVVDTFAQPMLRGWQRDLYRMEWVQPIDRRAAGRELPRLLERGEAVMIVAESERRLGKAHCVDFLGRRLRVYPTLARLAKCFDVPVVTATCTRREASLEFDVDFGGIVHYDQWNDEAAVMQEILARLEGAISRRPEQYLWSVPTVEENELRLAGEFVPMSDDVQGAPREYESGFAIPA